MSTRSSLSSPRRGPRAARRCRAFAGTGRLIAGARVRGAPAHRVPRSAVPQRGHVPLLPRRHERPLDAAVADGIPERRAQLAAQAVELLDRQLARRRARAQPRRDSVSRRTGCRPRRSRPGRAGAPSAARPRARRGRRTRPGSPRRRSARRGKSGSISARRAAACRAARSGRRPRNRARSGPSCGRTSLVDRDPARDPEV